MGTHPHGQPVGYVRGYIWASIFCMVAISACWFVMMRPARALASGLAPLVCSAWAIWIAPFCWAIIIWRNCLSKSLPVAAFSLAMSAPDIMPGILGIPRHELHARRRDA